MEQTSSPARRGPRNNDNPLIGLPEEVVDRYLAKLVPDMATWVLLTMELKETYTTRQLYRLVWGYVQPGLIPMATACSDKMCRFYLYYSQLPDNTSIHSLSVCLRRHLKRRVEKEGYYNPLAADPHAVPFQ